jgi:hypothetical protein
MLQSQSEMSDGEQAVADSIVFAIILAVVLQIAGSFTFLVMSGKSGE